MQAIEITMQNPYKLACSLGEKTLMVDIGVHPKLDGSTNVLVYFPLKPRWELPHSQEAITADMTDSISDRIEASLQGMGYKVTFCLPMGRPA